MSYKIMLVDCAAQWFIARLTEGMQEHYASFSDLEEYGHEVVEYLHELGHEAHTSFSRWETECLFESEEKYFSPAEHGLMLNPRISRSDLIQRYSGYLPLDMLLAYNYVMHEKLEKNKPAKT